MKSRLLRHTIWAPGSIPPERVRFAGLLRWVLPLHDACFIVAGVSGWFIGSRAAELVVGDAASHIWSAVLTLAATVALIGLSFHRHWIEVIGKIAVLGALWYYTALLAVRLGGEPDTVGTVAFLIVVTLLPIWRLVDLGYLVWRRETHRAATEREV